MRSEIIRAVAGAIENKTLPIGFNMRDYFRRTSPEVPDWTGRDCEFCTDIAGWTCMLFTRDGLRRIKPITLSHLKMIVENTDMLRYVEQAFDISEQAALDLCSPGHWQESPRIRNTLLAGLPAQLACDVLETLARDGTVVWDARHHHEMRRLEASAGLNVSWDEI